MALRRREVREMKHNLRRAPFLVRFRRSRTGASYHSRGKLEMLTAPDHVNGSIVRCLFQIVRRDGRHEQIACDLPA